MARGIIIVLDSLGIGGAPDAKHFKDQGSNTLANIALYCNLGLAENGRSGKLKIPNLVSLGIYNATFVSSGVKLDGLKLEQGTFAAATSCSFGKDTPSGHWELMGLPVNWHWHYFKKRVPVFPKRSIDRIISEAGLNGILGNCHASGTKIIDHLGHKHMETGMPIFYTSTDSVVQVAAHEEVFGLKKLYDLCMVTAGVFQPMGVCRIIARPFLGGITEDFFRTLNRKDFPVSPSGDTLCDLISQSGAKCYGIGKIGDIFNRKGITTFKEGETDLNLFNAIIDCMDFAQEGDLIFANLVEFDSKFGHRRDVSGYARALENFDKELPNLLSKMDSDDLLIITADHGNDPTAPGSDHTRERVPVLFHGKKNKNGNIGLISFSDVGQTMAEHLGIKSLKYGLNVL